MPISFSQRHCAQDVRLGFTVAVSLFSMFRTLRLESLKGARGTLVSGKDSPFQVARFRVWGHSR